MTPLQRQRAEAISRLIRLGWNPPVPSDAVTQRILDDIGAIPNRAGRFAPTTRLTHREQQTLELVAAGLTRAEIAERLGCSVDTVKDRQDRIRLKLGARNNVHAVAVGWRDGLLEVT